MRTRDNLLKGAGHHEGERRGLLDDFELRPHHKERDDAAKQHDAESDGAGTQAVEVGRRRQHHPKLFHQQ